MSDEIKNSKSRSKSGSKYVDYKPLEWWKRALGIGNKKGEGALAKRRKKVVDDNIKKSGAQ